MKRFWGYAKNEKFSVGCTGQTTYVYDYNGVEAAKFKDIKYAYTPMFCPNKNMFIVKSTDGWLVFYSLDNFQLIKKIHFSKIGAQDEGLCFSPDGTFLFNIEKPNQSTATELVIYETGTFQEIRRLFRNEKTIVLSTIEYDANDNNYYVLGFLRGENGIYDKGFVAKLDDKQITDIHTIDNEYFDYLKAYKYIEKQGFTEQSIKWSILKDKELKPVQLSDVIRAK